MPQLTNDQRTFLIAIGIAAVTLVSVVGLSQYAPPSPPPCKTNGAGSDAVIVCSGITVKVEEAVKFAIAYNAARAAIGSQPMPLTYAISGH